jgi:hypothetical protein
MSPSPSKKADNSCSAIVPVGGVRGSLLLLFHLRGCDLNFPEGSVKLTLRYPTFRRERLRAFGSWRGVHRVIVSDGDDLEIGNLVRHTLTMKEIGDNKAQAVAKRLRAISPTYRGFRG